MPYVETVDDLAESLADAVGIWHGPTQLTESGDWLVESLADALGIWGACFEGERVGSCDQKKWCRVCWTIDLRRRIREAVQREKGDK